MGKALDEYDVEVHPSTAKRGPTITVDDEVYQALEERAARSGMTAHEPLEAGLGAAMLLSELDDPPEEREDTT